MNKSNRVAVAAIAGILVLAATTYIFIAHAQSFWPYHHPSSSSVITSPSLLPAKDDPNTPDPTYPSTKTSDHNTSSNDDGSQTVSKKQSVSVAVTYAGVESDPATIDVHAFISGVIEGSGTCTATLTKNSINVTGSAPAFIDATTTQCETIQIPRTKVSSGTWQVIVSYDSPTSTGKSQAMVMPL